MGLDEPDDYGMHEMDDDKIETYLRRKSVGVLGISTTAAPMLRPMSFWYDGDSALYFVYVLGDDSQKAMRSEQADVATFLVYDIETTFNWRSVLLTGTIEKVPDDEQAAFDEEIQTAWRPDVFERAGESSETVLYRLHIDDQTGIEQLTLPQRLRTESSMSRPD